MVDQISPLIEKYIMSMKYYQAYEKDTTPIKNEHKVDI